MIKMIAACDPNFIIGINNKIPWKNSTDLKRFKTLTENTTILMGRKTFESIGRVLPKRINVVLSRNHQENIPTAGLHRIQDLDKFFSMFPLPPFFTVDLWVIGGAEIYQLSFPYVEEIDLTIVNSADLNVNPEDQVTYFPKIPWYFRLAEVSTNEQDPNLIHRRYVRKWWAKPALTKIYNYLKFWK